MTIYCYYYYIIYVLLTLIYESNKGRPMHHTLLFPCACSYSHTHKGT